MVIFSAHRGIHKTNSDILENTIPAFQIADEMGIELIELDVHLTKDDKWIVYHDFKFKNDKPMEEITFSELKKSSANLDYRIDTLEEVLDAFPEVKFNIECKPKSKEAGKKLAECIVNKKALEYCHISSFSTDVLRGAREISEDIRLSQIDLTFLIINWKKIHDEINLYSINPFYSFTRKKLVTRAHDRGVEVHVWTVNKEKMMKKMIKRKVDVIVTDFPDIGLNLIS